jgi:uncharacterized NAD(P)/FAD-binding protein YdhS
MAGASIAVIGGGFTGSLLSIHLLREAPPDTRLYLFDRSGCFGSGLAYSTKHAGHLLNVPAGRMSAFPDRPRDFLTWLERQPCHVLAGVAPAENAFVPRHLYGAYMRDLLLDARCGAAADRLILQRDGVVAIEDDGSRLTLRLLFGGSLRVDAAVVAGGNIPASPVSAPSRLGLSRTTRRRPPVCRVQRASIPDSSLSLAPEPVVAPWPTRGRGPLG